MNMSEKQTPEHDPLVADRVLDAVFNGLKSLTPPQDATASRYYILDSNHADPTLHRINVISGDGVHAVATRLKSTENGRILSMSVKRLPPGGRPTVTLAFTPELVSLTVTPFWSPERNKSELWVSVTRGATYGPAEAQFMQDTGLAEVCPAEYVQTVPINDARGFVLKDPTVLTALIGVPTKAANLPLTA
jgi:hypothetical protein